MGATGANVLLHVSCHDRVGSEAEGMERKLDNSAEYSL
jgi:hypothetical protein